MIISNATVLDGVGYLHVEMPPSQDPCQVSVDVADGLLAGGVAASFLYNQTNYFSGYEEYYDMCSSKAHSTNGMFWHLPYYILVAS